MRNKRRENNENEFSSHDYQQLRRKLSSLRRRKRRTASVMSGYEIVCSDKGLYRKADTAGEAAVLADYWAQQYPDHYVHVWSPAQQQFVYQVVGREKNVKNPKKDRKYKKTPSSRMAGFDSDESIAAELVMWVNNTEPLYKQKHYIEENLANKMAAGRFNETLAPKAYMHLLEEAAKDYLREFGTQGDSWHAVFPMSVRRIAAKDLLDEFLADVEINPQDYAGRMPKKHMPKWQERYSRVRRKSNGSRRAGSQQQQQQQKEGTTMARRKPISPARKRRLQARVEEIRRRNTEKRRNAKREDSEVKRLERRVASLERLLKETENELKAEKRNAQAPKRRRASTPRKPIMEQPRERPSKTIRERQARVREIKTRLERAQREQERVAKRQAAARRPEAAGRKQPPRYRKTKTAPEKEQTIPRTLVAKAKDKNKPDTVWVLVE